MSCSAHVYLHYDKQSWLFSFLEAKTMKKGLMMGISGTFCSIKACNCGFNNERVLIWVVDLLYIYILTKFREYWCINKHSRGKNDKKMTLQWAFLVHFAQSRPVIVV